MSASGIISLGLGSPAGIADLTLFGLNVNEVPVGPVASSLISLGIGSPAGLVPLTYFGLEPATTGAGVALVSGPFIGDLQGVAVLSEALELADVQALLATALWTDVTADVDGSQPLVVDRGIHEDSPLTRLAATGICTFAMDNSERNSAALLGYYSPGHANARAGFDRGCFVRVSMLTSEGERIPQFVGKLRTIKPTAGIYRDRVVMVMATDWLDEAARFPVEGIPTQVNVRADQVIELLVDGMRNRPHGLSIDTGTDVYPFVFDNSPSEDSSIQQELKKTADSERGLIYVSGDGTLVHESRYARTVRTDVEYTLTDILDADQTRSTEDIVNRVKVTIHPRRPDDDNTTVLYTNDSAIRIEHAAESTIFLPFRDPEQQATRIGAIEVIDPSSISPVTDYAINTEEDGTGTDLTSNPGITVTFAIEATGVQMTVTNQSGYRIFFPIGDLQVRGKGLYHYDPLTLISENQTSIQENGVQQVEFDMPHQDRVGVGQGAADLFLNTFQATPTKVGSVPFYLFQSEAHQRLGAYGDLSTRIAYEELMGAVSGEFFVNAKRIEWRLGNNVDITVWLTPADTQEYARFDVSRFDDAAARFAY